MAAGVTQQVGGAMEPFELCQVIPGLEEKVTGTATGELPAAAVAANKGPFKVAIGRNGKVISLEDLGMPCRSIITNCTVAGTNVSECVIGGAGRYLIVVCGRVGKDVVEVALVDENLMNETKFKVDIGCALTD
jgi:hypothetical protein